ncbi:MULTISPECIES: MalY/PatB family protein [unclassified Jeotgalibaca]|uniref:MalY/PatB family protein n=1 Tax=unclassified Jeotgalibaca TaxID=2621505 RepID=UPI003FD2C651
MKYDFTKRVDRKSTGSAKWEEMYKWNPNVETGVLPMSVADMEFQTAPEITEGLKRYLDEAVLGYTIPYPSFLDAVIQWQKDRHDWEIQPEWLVNTPGVVTAFYGAIRTFSEEDDGVIIFRPVYHPFGQAIADNHRTEVNVPLIHKNGTYEIDFEAFEEAAADPKNKILLFCSPHNPVGRVWRREELEKIAEIAIEHNLYVISDEIWYDFVMPGYTHTVLATVDDRLKERLITCTAPSKTFNLAGMMLSNIIIADPALREQFRQAMAEVRIDMVGILGYKACELAYTKSREWLDELIQVIHHNAQLVEQFFAEHYPKVTVTKLEGTYVQWLDFRGLGMTTEELETFLHQEAQFFTDEGYIFGAEGNGFERINLALPTTALAENLERLLVALKNLDSLK